MVRRSIDHFHCVLDKDIEYFLKNKSIDFLNRGFSNTFLIFSEESILVGDYQIEGYFTLSHKAIPRSENISNTQSKKISGSPSSEILSFALVGQIGKKHYFNKEGSLISSNISLSDIFHYVNVQLHRANEYIPIKWILVECNDIIHKKGLYEKEGFTYFQYDGSHHQYIRTIGSKNKT